jgi:hypothetical protein
VTLIYALRIMVREKRKKKRWNLYLYVIARIQSDSQCRINSNFVHDLVTTAEIGHIEKATDIDSRRGQRRRGRKER